MKIFLVVAIALSPFGCYSQMVKEKTQSKIRIAEGLQSSAQIDSLKYRLSLSNNEEKFQINFELFREYLPINSDSADLHLNRSLDFVSAIGDSLSIVKCLNGKGFLFERRGNVREAILTFGNALEIARRNNFEDQERYLLNNLALAHTGIASYDMALYYNFESLRKREKGGNQNEISVTLNNIGFVYHELGDYENALHYYEGSRDIIIKDGVKRDLVRVIINIGLVFNELHRFKEAQARIEEAFEICGIEHCSTELAIEANQAMGEALFNQDELQSSIFFFKESLKLSRAIGLAKYVALNLYWLARVNYNQNNLFAATWYLEESQSVAQKADLQKRILGNYLLYVRICSAEKNYRKALEFQELYSQLDAQILNGEMVNKISRIQADHVERANTEKIISQERIMNLQGKTIFQHKLLSVAFGLATVFAMGFTITLFKISRRRKLMNLRLSDMVKERTKQLEQGRDAIQHLHEEEIGMITRALNSMSAHLATFRGLQEVRTLDGQVHDDVYRREIENTAAGLEEFARQLHLLLRKIGLESK